MAPTSPPPTGNGETIRDLIPSRKQKSRAALASESRCATDITGFGLLGHASHIARASNVTLRIDSSKVPILDGALEALKQGATTDGMKRNSEYVAQFVEWKASADERRDIFSDPQTSGGLLVAVPRARLANYLSRVEGATEIGEVLERENIAIVVD